MTKELFQEVSKINLGSYFCQETEVHETFWIDESTSSPYICWEKLSETFEINLYEFANMIKSWALNHGFHINSSKEAENMYIANFNNGWDHLEFRNKTEYEAVIDAGEWILKKIQIINTSTKEK